MRPDPLLPGQRDLEHELAGRTCPEPPAGLRDRILAAVSAERQAATPRRPRNLWNAVWPAAAAVVLALNLAMSARNGVRYEAIASRVAEPGGVALHTGTDDRFQTFAANALAQLTATPDAGSVSRGFFEREEN